MFTDQEWIALTARQSWRGPLLVAHAWAVIALAMAVVAIWPNPVTVVAAVMLVGARQLGLAILMHEAAHGALHPDRKINDGLGHWLCAAPVGARLASYRAYHLSHHKYVQQPEDPDLVLVAPFPISRASLRRKIIRDLTGQTFLKQRFGVMVASVNKSATVHVSSVKAAPAGRGAHETEPRKPEPAAPDGHQIVSDRGGVRDHLIVNGVLLLILTLSGYWWLYPLVWLLALATWFPFVTRIRNIAEHAGIARSDDPLAHARTTHARWWERLLIAPYWVHYHAEHHAFMHLPCYRLKRVHQALLAKGFGAQIPQAPGYGAVLREVTIPSCA